MSLPTLDNLAPKEAGGAATKFPGIVADLDTRPNAIGGLSAAELKAKFDEAARVIQNYINNVLLPALLSSGATSIGYQTSSDLPDYQPSTVDDALAGLETLIASLLPIKNNGKVCFCNNLTIPASGSISVAYNSIYPRPMVGDYVINQHGEMGHITSVVIGDAVTVTAANYTLKAVLTDETQNLSATQKVRARSNIGALGSADTEAKYVKYDDYANYTDAQKATARANIGALEKANPHVETGMTVDGVLDAEGGIEAYDDVTVEGALTVKNAAQEHGISVSQTDAAVLSFAGATPQTRPVLRNIGTPVLSNDAANKAYVDAKAGLSETAKQALLNCFAHVAWIDEHGQGYYDALEAALYPPADLVSISAVFNQGQTVVYDTDNLDVLKPMLTVTAHYSDATSETVTAYTLSGTLTDGTSTIAVSYGGKTATFDVVVAHNPVLFEWDFTQSLVDKMQGVEAVANNVTRDSAGCNFSGSSSARFTAKLIMGSTNNPVFQLGNTIRIKFGQMTANFSGNTGTRGSTYSLPNGCVLNGPCVIAWRGANDKFYDCTSGWLDVYQSTDPAYFSNKTLEIVTTAAGGASIYVDDTLFGTLPSGTITTQKSIILGGWADSTYHDMVIESVKVVESE